MLSLFLAPLLLIIAAIVGLFGMATAVTIGDFTKLNATGNCADSKGKRFATATSPEQAYTNDMDMLNYCLSYCAQNLPTTFRGFETVHYIGNNPFRCNCRFDLPAFNEGTDPFPYNYTPANEFADSEDGTGAITGVYYPDPSYDLYQCYKYDATAQPTKAPTKSPTKPFSCPAGHPPCVEASDCAGLQHCVDSCCANIGSKSAKGTKSSKRV